MSWWGVIVTKSKIMTYCVSQIAGKNMRLKWVYINADSNRSFSANPSNTCCSRLASWKGISSPEIFFLCGHKLDFFVWKLSNHVYWNCYLRTRLQLCGYDIIWISLAFSGQLSNTTEIELLDTKLDPYIWFTALLSEFFLKIKNYTHVNIWVVSFSILWSFLWA